MPAKKTPLGVRKETVFLSGTDRVKDVLSQLYGGLKRMGFRPWWFRQPDFPHLADNAMDACLAAARICDRFVLVLDDRSGLPYGPTGTTITEAEFNCAHERGIPCLVFVRAKIWHQAPVYHRNRKPTGNVDTKEFAKLALDGDQEVYEFIERIQHKQRRGEPTIAWITPFELGDEILKAIRNKWLISDKIQKEVLAQVLRVANESAKEPIASRTNSGIETSSKAKSTRSILVPKIGTNVVMDESAAYEIQRLSQTDQEAFRSAVEDLRRGIASIGNSGIEYVTTLQNGKRILYLSVGTLSMKMSWDPVRPTRVNVYDFAKPYPSYWDNPD